MVTGRESDDTTSMTMDFDGKEPEIYYVPRKMNYLKLHEESVDRNHPYDSTIENQYASAGPEHSSSQRSRLRAEAAVDDDDDRDDDEPIMIDNDLYVSSQQMKNFK